MGLLRKPSDGPVDNAGWAAADLEASALFPWLVEFLGSSAWDDGSRRETGTVMVLAEDGLWKAWIHDRAGLRSAWVSSDSLLGLADTIEQGLSQDRLAWRPDRSRGKKG